jgi:hypothetical protein
MYNKMVQITLKPKNTCENSSKVKAMCGDLIPRTKTSIVADFQFGTSKGQGFHSVYRGMTRFGKFGIWRKIMKRLAGFIPAMG